MGTKNKKPETTRKTYEFEPEKQTFKEHLSALRSRLLWLGGSVLVAAIIGFEFKDLIQGAVTMQLNDLNTFNLAGADDTLSTMQMSLYVAVLVGLPLTAYHAYRFLEPILNKGSAYAVKLLSGSVALIIAALSLAFMVTIPLALHGMVGKGQDASLVHLTVQTFLNFAVTNSIVLAILFQLPLAIIFVNSVQPFSKKKLSWLQRIVPIIIIAASWIATPFGSFNRGVAGALVIAVPSLALFQASLFWARKHAKPVVEVAKAPAPAKETPLTDTIEREIVEEQPAPAPAPTHEVPAPAVFAFNAPQTIAETEQLEPFPEEMFDAMLEDKDEFAYDEESGYAPLPSSLEVIDEPAPRFNAPVVAQPAPKPVVAQAAPVVAAQPVTPLPVAAPAPAPVVIAPAQRRPIVQPTPVKPVVQAQAAPTPKPAQPAPRFAASFSAVKPQPIVQPQPQPKPLVYSQQITETIKPQQTQTPPLRSLNAPQPVVPFQMRPAMPYGNTIEGMLPA